MEILSLLTLFAVIAVSCFSKINPGLLSLGLAWGLGHYGAKIPINQIIAAFPVHTFIMLTSVTYLFGLAKHNGTLEGLARLGLKLIRGKTAFAPLLCFMLAAILSTIGAGNIGAVALLAPIAMTMAWETGIGAFFMTITLICGANAGAFSPFAVTGIIANGLTSKIGLRMDPWMEMYLPNFFAQSILALICYIILYWQIAKNRLHHHATASMTTTPDHVWNPQQKATILAIAILLIGVVFFKMDVGFLSIAIASLLVFANVSDGKEAIKHIPLDTILMVCGVNTLIGLLETLGGMVLLTDLLAKIATPDNVTGLIAFITGIISAFSSSSGVVLPTFIPLVPGLIERLGSGDAAAIVSSINVGAHLVDISPLSSLGALCVASALHEDKEKLFRRLLGFGLSMALAGAVICYILFGR